MQVPGLDKECCSIEFIQRKPFISFILAIAELLENDGNDELRKKDKECCSIEFIQRKPFISFILAIAELLENDGNDELRKKDKECCSIEFIQRKPFISFILAIAELLENDGNDELRKKDFRNAIFLYTQGIQIDCKDRELKAKLYSNRATAYFNLGEKKVLRFSSFFQVSILSQKF